MLTFSLAAGLIVLIWLPSLQLLGSPVADQVWENYSIGQACLAQPDQLGWLGAASPQVAATLFEPSLPGRWLLQLACGLGRVSSLHPLQSYLLVGQGFTWLLAVISCRWLGFSRAASWVCGLLLAAAPCAFSRIGHLGLAVLIPIVPVLAACLQLRRQMMGPVQPGWRKHGAVLLSGGLAALLSFPAQDYYVAFAVLVLIATYGLLLLLATTVSIELRPLAPPVLRGGLFLFAYGVVVILLFTPKLLAAGLPGPPAGWGALRSPVEQFRYGLLPFTWLIASPWVDATRAALQQAGIETFSESYFWSTGSLLIPIGWVFALRRLAKPCTPHDEMVPPRFWGARLSDRDRRFCALLLLLVSGLGLLCMTMGGLGTLFALWVTPVLRSLNRFTVFVYGAAVLYLLAEWDLWMQRHDRSV